ncbi:acyltransferase family protein [Pseudomonas benzenivorans]|uniref:Acyltransferase n=1 Tax=Pseudomonas benzenivorans TaxID=556533 RepID=A0ABY5H5A0_9PSED|nr:acyltransferase [Pseudomonas benzenivorans]UTW07485.1 acyltransferase [Pseudomonas benzenivorans]
MEQIGAKGVGAETWKRLAVYRGLAAVLVVFGHCVQVFVRPAAPELAPYTGLLAQASVMMFFVVSGFSIAASADKVFQHPFPIRQYVIKRAGRILPPLLFAVGVMCLLDWLVPYVFVDESYLFLPQERMAREGYHFNWSETLGALFFLNGFFSTTPLVNGPLWSLSYEVWLYAIYFFLFIALKLKRWIFFVVAFAIIAILAKYDSSGARNFFLKYSLVWFSGALVYIVVIGRWGVINNILRCLIVVFACLSAALAGYFGWLFVVNDMSYDIARYNVAFGFAFALYLLLTRPAMPSVMYAVFKPISHFGYTLYLIHFPIYLFVFGAFQTYLMRGVGSAWLIGMGAMVCSMIVAYMAAKIVEQRKLFIGKVV